MMDAINNTTKRENWIDQVRGYAMFTVLISHSLSNVLQETYMFLMMPLFFCISGYLHKTIENPDLNKLKKRIIYRIGIPYLFFSGLWVIQDFLRTGDTVILVDNVINIVTGRTFWFLPCLAVVEILSTIIDKVFFILHTRLLYSKLFVVLVGLFFMYIVPTNSSCPFYFDTALTALPFYYIGNILKDSFELKFRRWLVIVPLISFILFHLISRFTIDKGCVFNMSTNYNDNPLITFVLATSGIVSVISLFRTFNLGYMWASIGRNTMFFYGVNVYALCIGRYICHYIPIFPEGGYFWTLFEVMVAVIVCLGCSYPVNKYLPLIVGNRK